MLSFPPVATPLCVKWEDETPTPKVGDLESSGTPECLEFDSRDQNTLHWGVLGVIGKVLKCRCPKCPRIGHLDICSPSYGQKKGRESRPLKVGNRPLPTSESGVRHGVGKLSKRAITLVQTSSWSDVAVGKYDLPKSRDSNGDSFETILRLQLGSPEKKSHSDVASAEWRREYYMGEGGGFPRVRAVVSLVCQSARGLSQHPRVFPNVN
jgi:hypothetical protein